MAECIRLKGIVEISVLREVMRLEIIGFTDMEHLHIR